MLSMSSAPAIPMANSYRPQSESAYRAAVQMDDSESVNGSLSGCANEKPEPEQNQQKEDLDKPLDFSVKKRKTTEAESDFKRTNLSPACSNGVTSATTMPLQASSPSSPASSVNFHQNLAKIEMDISDDLTTAPSNDILISFISGGSSSAPLHSKDGRRRSAFETVVQSSNTTGLALESLQHNTNGSLRSNGFCSSSNNGSSQRIMMQKDTQDAFISSNSSAFLSSSSSTTGSMPSNKTAASPLHHRNGGGLASENLPASIHIGGGGGAFSLQTNVKSTSSLLPQFLQQSTANGLPNLNVDANGNAHPHLQPSSAKVPPRPFKSYNPTEPATALQLGHLSGLPPFLGGVSPMNNGSLGSMNSFLGLAQPEQLLTRYRQLIAAHQQQMSHHKHMSSPSLSSFQFPTSLQDSTIFGHSSASSAAQSNQRVGLSASNHHHHQVLSGRMSEPIKRRPSGCSSSGLLDPIRKPHQGRDIDAVVAAQLSRPATTDAHCGASTPSPPQVTSTTCSNPSSSPENRGPSPLSADDSPMRTAFSQSNHHQLVRTGGSTPLSVNTDVNTVPRPASNTSANGSLPHSKMIDIEGGIVESSKRGGSMSSNSSGSESSAPSSTVPTRRRGRSLPEDMKDDQYWERRRKNNEAAKRSRDARRAKEDEIAIRATLLENENLKLRIEVAALKTDIEKLRQLLLNS